MIKKIQTNLFYNDAVVFNFDAKHSSEIKGDDFDTESILTSLNADFYEFIISDKAPDTQEKSNSDNASDLSALPELP